MTTNENSSEAPLTWTAKNEYGAVGRTYRATVTLDNGDTWKFVVDQPRKGVWTNRRRPAGCSCPTPTHRMSCGHGARPKVVQKRTPRRFGVTGSRVVLVNEGARLLDAIEQHDTDACLRTCCGGNERN